MQIFGGGIQEVRLQWFRNIKVILNKRINFKRKWSWVINPVV